VDTALALFASVHYVLAAERGMKKAGLWYDIVPTPRKLTSECGLAVEFRLQDLASFRGICANGDLRLTGIWRMLAGEPQAVEEAC